MKLILFITVFLITPVFAYADSNWGTMIWNQDIWYLVAAIPTLGTWGMIIMTILLASYSIYTLKNRNNEKLLSYINKNRLLKSFFILYFLFTSALVAYAATTVPKTFVAGTPAIAEDVNENFTHLADRSWEKTGGSDLYHTGGNVGIGTTSPTAKLDVKGNVLFQDIVDGDTSVDIRPAATSGNPNLRLLNSSGTANGIFGYDQDNDAVYLVHDSTFEGSMKGIVIDNNGHVIIGFGFGGSPVPSSAQLFVNQLSGVDPFNIGGSTFIVNSSGNVGINTANPQGTLDVNGPIFQRGSSLHADYVFESDYKLESIEEHSDFMWQNRHLKSIPKRKVDEKGVEIVEVGSHRKGIVEELEKAHIYIEQLHQQNQALEERLAKLEALLSGGQ